MIGITSIHRNKSWIDPTLIERCSNDFMYDLYIPYIFPRKLIFLYVL